mgnify:CR=1 FL=1|jgi:hypothetical protein|tara:strand:- start:8135 stop:8668 length:534 start_codon:yes stop_codon:yes gene_type:complete
MEFKNTIQALQKLGNNVVKEGKGILKKKKKTTSGNTLFNDFDYLVTNQRDSVTLEFEFGGAEDYWQFVDEGVKGVGGFKGSGRARGQGSDFKFSSKMPPRGVIDRWIVSKPLAEARDERGRFISRKSLAFLIQRSIFQRGLERTQFFSKPFTEQLNKQTDNITEAFANDLEIALEQI